jgi:hypothetical protein
LPKEYKIKKLSFQRAIFTKQVDILLYALGSIEIPLNSLALGNLAYKLYRSKSF